MPENKKLPTDLRWCVSTLGCAALDLPQVIALAKPFGINELELRALDDRLDLPVYLEETFGSPAALAAELEQASMQVTVLDTSFKLIGAGEQDRRDFLAFVPWAEALDVPFLRVFDGGQLQTSPDNEALDEASRTVHWWQELRRENGWRVDIAVETHDAFCNAGSCLALEERLAAPCPILWDAHHTFHKAGEPIAETWAALQPFIRHVHFKDSTAAANEVNDYTLAVPGSGRFPVAELIGLIRRDRFRGAVCLEWERKWQPWVPPLEEALAGLIESV